MFKKIVSVIFKVIMAIFVVDMIGAAIYSLFFSGSFATNLAYTVDYALRSIVTIF
ncbi:MAG: hypothetical protein PVH63_10075 [Balneolaceae bacterium]|jgi:hypothetical protein